MRPPGSARRSAVGLSAHGSEEVSSAGRPAFRRRRRRAAPLQPRRTSVLLAASLVVGTHHDEEREEILQPEHGRMEAVLVQPDHRRVPGALRQELGFDLALLPSLLCVPGCTLCIHNVGYASDPER